jgi:hypothetical protein
MATTPVDITDTGGTNFAEVTNAAVVGAQYGLVVRNIVSAANVAFICSQVSVTTSNMKISNGSPYTSRREIKIKNGGVNTVFLGPDNTVSATTGYALLAGEAESFDMGPNLSVYAITGSGTSQVYTMELG